MGINTCNQPCSVPVNMCPAQTPYCSTTGVCFATIKSVNGMPVAESSLDSSCSAPIYPYIVMAVGLAVAAAIAVSAICITRRRGSNYGTVLIEEMKRESMHMPSREYSPFPAHQSQEP